MYCNLSTLTFPKGHSLQLEQEWKKNDQNDIYFDTVLRLGVSNKVSGYDKQLNNAILFEFQNCFCYESSII